jgi:hypothetical protein
MRNTRTPVAAFLTGLGTVLAVHSASSDSSSAPPSAPLATGSIVFRPFASIAGAGEVALANGVRVKPDEWRTVLVAIIGTQILADGSNKPSTCTAVLVGPGVFLTAAHCIDGGAGEDLHPDIALQIGDAPIQAHCLVAKAYRDAVDAKVWHGHVPRVSEDYAICGFVMPAALPAALVNLRYEVVESKAPLRAGSAVLMTGLGCDQMTLADSGEYKTAAVDGKLRVGDATVTTAAALDGGVDSNYVRIVSTKDQPALCPGDSGGPLISGVSAKTQVGERRVRGINSTIFPDRTENDDPIFISRIASSSTPSFQDLEKEWVGDSQERFICGYNQDAGTTPCGH